jgi:hypothetical protein
MNLDAVLSTTLMNRQLTHLAPIDMLILVVYIIAVIFISFYVTVRGQVTLIKLSVSGKERYEKS